jgi:hypothetical protein
MGLTVPSGGFDASRKHPATSEEGPHGARVATVVTDGANPFERAVASEVFGLERPELDVEWYEHRLCTPGPVTLHGGMRGHARSRRARRGGHRRAPPRPPPRRASPRAGRRPAAAHAGGARLVSFCSGAFTLAETGALDGRRATTHWLHAEAFRRRIPRVRLDPNVLVVDEGDVLTSAGTAAGIDLALHIVRLDPRGGGGSDRRPAHGRPTEPRRRAGPVHRAAARPAGRRGRDGASCSTGSCASSTATSRSPRWRGRPR